MQYYFLITLSIPFLYLNFKIIKNDLKYKIIPNKYLLYLLFIIPVYYLYIFIYFDINIIYFIAKIFISFFVSFLLYYFGVWSAGDAKYLLVLGLYIPHLSMLTFIGNIAILTLLYLFIYFLWFYTYKIHNLKGVKNQISKDIKDKWMFYKKINGGNTIKVLTKRLTGFLIIFIAIRLIRIYTINGIIDRIDIKNLDIINNYLLYIFILIIFISIGIFKKMNNLFIIIKNFIKVEYKIKKIELILFLIILISLISFILFEYRDNKELLLNNIKTILSIYLLIYIFFIIIKYTYNITFNLTETQLVNINKLKPNEIVNKKYLINLFSKQPCLGHKENLSIKEEEIFRLKPNPKIYFENIDNPIDNKTVKELKKIYKTVNNYHKNKDKYYIENNNIKIENTFDFAKYIFIGFIITFIFNNQIIKLLNEIIIEQIKKVF